MAEMERAALLLATRPRAAQPPGAGADSKRTTKRVPGGHPMAGHARMGTAPASRLPADGCRCRCLACLLCRTHDSGRSSKQHGTPPHGRGRRFHSISGSTTASASASRPPRRRRARSACLPALRCHGFLLFPSFTGDGPGQWIPILTHKWRIL